MLSLDIVGVGRCSSGSASLVFGLGDLGFLRFRVARHYEIVLQTKCVIRKKGLMIGSAMEPKGSDEFEC